MGLGQRKRPERGGHLHCPSPGPPALHPPWVAGEQNYWGLNPGLLADYAGAVPIGKRADQTYQRATTLYIHVHVYAEPLRWRQEKISVLPEHKKIPSNPLLQFIGWVFTIHVHVSGSQSKLCWTVLMRDNKLETAVRSIYLLALVHLIFFMYIHTLESPLS